MRGGVYQCMSGASDGEEKDQRTMIQYVIEEKQRGQEVKG